MSISKDEFEYFIFFIVISLTCCSECKFAGFVFDKDMDNVTIFKNELENVIFSGDSLDDIPLKSCSKYEFAGSCDDNLIKSKDALEDFIVFEELLDETAVEFICKCDFAGLSVSGCDNWILRPGQLDNLILSKDDLEDSIFFEEIPDDPAFKSWKQREDAFFKISRKSIFSLDDLTYLSVNKDNIDEFVWTKDDPEELLLC